MNNFMQCSMMMFGKLVRFCVAYKTNQPGFVIYTRSSFHNFRVAIDSKNWEGAIGVNLGKLGDGLYAISKHNEINIFEANTFKLRE